MLILSGIVFNLLYLLGVFFPDVTGLSLLPRLALFLLIISFRHPSIKIHYLFAMWSVMFLYLSGIIFSDWNSYAIYKGQMFILKVIPLMLIPFLLKERIDEFLVGYAIPMVLFLAICLVASMSLLSTVNINDRLEIGIFNPIWISRAAMELALLGFIIFRLKRPIVLLVLALVIPVIYVAGSKGPVLSFAFVFLFWYLNERCFTRGQRIRIMLIIGLLSIVVATSIAFINTDSYLYQRFLLQAPDGSEYIEVSRGIVWPLVMEKFINQDIVSNLLGNGL